MLLGFLLGENPLQLCRKFSVGNLPLGQKWHTETNHQKAQNINQIYKTDSWTFFLRYLHMSDIEIHILLLFVLADIQICSTKIHMGLGLSSCMKQCCLLSYQNYQTEICKEISKHIKGHISKIIKRIIVCIIYIYIQSIVSYHITSYRIIS